MRANFPSCSNSVGSSRLYVSSSFSNGASIISILLFQALFGKISSRLRCYGVRSQEIFDPNAHLPVGRGSRRICEPCTNELLGHPKLARQVCAPSVLFARPGFKFADQFSD